MQMFAYILAKKKKKGKKAQNSDNSVLYSNRWYLAEKENCTHGSECNSILKYRQTHQQRKCIMGSIYTLFFFFR